MASDMFNVEPPSWLQREVASTNPARAWGQLGNLAGRYLGAGLSTAAGTGDEQVDRKPPMQRFRTNLANTYKQDQDPQWRLKEFFAKTQYDRGRLQGEQLVYRNLIAQKTLQQQAESERELAELAGAAAKVGNNPMDIPYTGNNPFTSKQWGNVQLQYSRAMVSKRLDSDRARINKLVDELDAPDRSAFLQIPRGEDGMPTPEGWTFLNAASQRTQARKTAKDSKPMSPVGKLIHDREQVAAAGGDTSLFDKELSKEGGELIFEEIEYGGKKATAIRQAGKGGFRILQHDSDNRVLVEQLKAAYRQKQSAINALVKPQTALTPESKQMAQSALDSATAKIDEIESKLSNPASAAPANSLESDPLGLFK